MAQPTGHEHGDECMDLPELDLGAEDTLDAMDVGFDEFLRQLDEGGEVQPLGCLDDFSLDALLGQDPFEAQLANVPELRISSGADGDCGFSPLLSPADSTAPDMAVSPQASAGSAAPRPEVSGSGASSAKATSSCEAALQATAQDDSPLRSPKERNTRTHSGRTRQRRQRQANHLYERCNALEYENAELRARVQQLSAECERLRSAAACATATSASAVTVTTTTAAVCDASARAAANTSRFTAAVVKPPPRKPPALTPAQRQALSRPRPTGGSTAAPAPQPCAESHSGASTGIVAPLSVPSPLLPPAGAGHANAAVSIADCASTAVAAAGAREEARAQRGSRRKRTAEGLLGRPAKRTGLSLAGRSSTAFSAVGASVVLLGAAACLFAFSGSPLLPFSAGRPDLPLPLPDDAAGADFDVTAHRALLMATDGTGAADVARGMMPAAEFVCNRTSCVALDAAAAEPAPRPLALQRPTQSRQDELDSTMMTALRGLAPEALAMCARDAEPPAPPARAAPLRGSGQIVPAALAQPPALGAGGRRGFDQLADDAMSGAGLVSPGTCRLVYDSGAHENSTSSAAPRRRSARAAARAAAQRGENGFVILEKGVVAPQAATEGGRDRIVIESVGGGAGHLSSPREEGTTEPRSSAGGSQGLGADGAQVVSVMLPIKKGDADQPGVLTPLGHLYVVTMQPAEQRLLTYECALSYPVYV